MLIDFHSHNPQTSRANKLIYCHANLDVEIPQTLRAFDRLCIGLHPWFLPDGVEEGMKQLKSLYSLYPNATLGECGLDRIRGPEISLQMEFVKEQLQWAKEENFPFVVFHCVRCYPEFISLIKSSEYDGKIIFHDYRANPDITNQLLSFPQVYFSLGGLLFSSTLSDRQRETINLIPLSRLLLETDDSNREISEVYEKYLSITDGNKATLTQEMAANWVKLTL